MNNITGKLTFLWSALHFCPSIIVVISVLSEFIWHIAILIQVYAETHEGFRSLYPALSAVVFPVQFREHPLVQEFIDKSWKKKDLLSMINVKFTLQPHQKYYIMQCEELGFSWLTLMKDDYTTNSHCITYAFLFIRLGECTFWTWEWNINLHWQNAASFLYLMSYTAS